MGKRAVVKLSEFLRSNQTIEVYGNTVPVLHSFVSCSNHLFVARLNIGGNKLGSSNASILVDFVKASPSLRELDVSFLGISSSATHPLVDALVHNQSITTLNLSGNSIDKKLASELSRMIKNNKTISKLALRSCGLDKAIMVEICASLCDNTTLREMDLAGNRMDSSEAIEQLEVALETNKTLSSLNIAACRIDANGIYTLCAGLKENTVIERLHLDGNPIGNAGLMRLIEGLQGAKKLTIVTLQETSIHTSALLEFLRALGKSSAVDTLDIRRNSDIKVNEELRKNLLAYNYIAFSL
jgi:Ran GTPase-activating protein (RanGAP) involved in mRNA processing and transport